MSNISRGKVDQISVGNTTRRRTARFTVAYNTSYDYEVASRPKDRVKDIVVSDVQKCLVFKANGFILCVHVCGIDEDRESGSATLCVNLRYRLLGANRRIFRVSFIKALQTIKYGFDVYLSIKHGIFLRWQRQRLFHTCGNTWTFYKHVYRLSSIVYIMYILI